MAEIADLFVRLRAETAPFTSGMRRASEEGESFTTRMGGASAMLRKLGAATTLVGVGFVAYGVKAAGDFQQKMNLLVTACGESSKNLKKVSDGVMSLARETGTSTDQLAEGMYQVEKAGYRSGAGLQVLRAASQGAREEGANLKDVTNAMTSVMASYHLKASDSVRVMNALKTAAGEGKMTMEEFSSSLSTVIPIASANKISFGEVGGAIATLTQHGTSAREATQELASTIRQLAAPNNVAIQEMQRLGLSSTDVSTKLGKRGLSGTLDLLSRTVLDHMGKSGTLLLSSFNKTKQAAADANQMVKAMPPSLQKLATSYSKGSISLGDWRKELKTLPPEQANLLSQYATLQNKTKGFSAELKKGGPSAQTYTEAMKKLTGGAIGLNTSLQLTGENTEGFKDRVNKVSDSFNHASKDVEGWKITQQSFNVQMGRLKEAVTTAAIVVGTKLIPVILKAITFFEKHKTVAMALATVIGGVLAAAVVSFATGAVVGAVKGVMDLSRGILAAARAVKAFMLSERLAAIATKIWTGIQAAFNLVMDANPIMLVVLGIAALVAAVILAYNKIGWFRDACNTAFHAIGTAISWVVDWVKGHWPLLLAILAGPIAVAVVLIVKNWNKIVSGFKTAYRDVVNVGKLLIAWFAGIPSRAKSALVSLTSKIVSVAVTAWTAFKSTVISKAMSMIAWVAGIPSRAKSALGSLGHLLTSAGADMIRGLLNGIRSINVSSVLSGIAHGAVSAFKGALGISSPSKVFRTLGIYVNEGLVDGLTSSTAKVKTATKRIETLLIQTYNKVADQRGHKGVSRHWVSSHEKTIKRLEAYAHKEDRILNSLAKKRDSVATKIKAAQKKLADLQKQWSDEVKSVSSGIMQGFSVVTEAPQEGFALTAQDVVNKMRDQMSKAVNFAAQLQALKKKGLSADLIAQIASAGVDQGGATAAALAGASKGQIDQINALQKTTTSAATSAGKAVADSMYGSGIRAAQGLVKGLQSQEKSIEKQMMRIANAMKKAIKKALGIKSPSTVFAEIGSWIPKGLAKGVDGNAKHATTAVHRLAGSVAGAGTFARAGLAAGGGTTIVNHHYHFNIEGNVRTIDNLAKDIETAFLKRGMRNPTTYPAYKR